MPSQNTFSAEYDPSALSFTAQEASLESCISHILFCHIINFISTIIICNLSQSSQPVIQIMRPYQQSKTNLAFRTINNIAKSTHSATSIRSTKDCHKPLISRQRENDRNMNEHSQKKRQQKSQDSEIHTHTTAKMNYGRHHKATHSEVHIKRNEHEQPAEPVHGILISVNIQDLVTPRNATTNLANFQPKNAGQTPKLEKNTGFPLNDQKKMTLKTANKDMQPIEFECNEELLYRKRSSPPPRERTLSKHPTECKSQRSQQAGQKSKQKVPDLPKAVDQLELINTFVLGIDEINSLSASQSLYYLDSRQQFYRVSPTYIEDSQPNFTWKMRACVVEWMMEVSEQFSLKRETFHISVNLFDRFLEKESNLAKSSFQAVGAAAMFIASKLEQFEPKTSEDFAITTGRLITATKLKETQRRMCQVLQYNLNPPTLYRWANRLMLQWDSYIQQSPNARIHPFLASHCPKYFKQSSEEAYINYRLLLQLVDCSMLDIETSQYSPKIVVCSFMYLYLVKEYKLYTAKEIAHTFPECSRYLFDEDNLFNELFNQFLEFTFGFVLQDLLPTIQYCASYLIIPPNVEMPAPARKNSKLYEKMELEEYQSFQTFDKNMIKVIGKRRRPF